MGGHKIVDNDDSFKRRLDNLTKKVRGTPRWFVSHPSSRLRRHYFMAEQVVGNPKSLSSMCLQMRWGPNYASYGLHQGFISVVRIGSRGLWRDFWRKLNASNAKALDALFVDSRNGSSRKLRRHKTTSWVALLRRYWLFFIYVISKLDFSC